MLDPTCLNMLELVCKVPFFEPEGCSQVNHLIDPLKEASVFHIVYSFKH